MGVGRVFRGRGLRGRGCEGFYCMRLGGEEGGFGEREGWVGLLDGGMMGLVRFFEL